MLKQALVLTSGGVRCVGEEKKKCNMNVTQTVSASSEYQGNCLWYCLRFL